MQLCNVKCYTVWYVVAAGSGHGSLLYIKPCIAPRHPRGALGWCGRGGPSHSQRHIHSDVTEYLIISVTQCDPEQDMGPIAPFTH